MLKIQEFLSKQKVLLVLLLVLVLPVSSRAQEKGKEKIEAEAKTIRTSEEVNPRKISLSPEDSKFFQSLIDKNNKEIEQARKEAEMAARLLEQTQRAGKLEVQNLFLQFKEKYHIDDQWNFSFETMQFVEKEKGKVAPNVEKQGK